MATIGLAHPAQNPYYLAMNAIMSRCASRNGDGDEGEEAAKKGEGSPDFLMEKFLKTRTILVSGEIDKDLAERVVRQLIMLEAQSSEPIRVFIDSPGGDADAGFAVYDMLRFVDAPVWTIGMGLVASAASIIALAAPAERRVGLPNSHYLIHQPLSGMRGVASEIEIHARELDKMKKRINELYAKETGKKVSQVEKDTDRDFWMGADEAKAYGLISRVIASRKELDA